MKTAIIAASLLLGGAFIFQAYAQETQGQLQGYIVWDDLEETVEAQYLEVNNEMNALYDELSRRLDPTGKTRLENSQKAWKAYRKAECVFEADYMRDEPVEHLLYVDCLGSITEERVAYLGYKLEFYYPDPSLAEHDKKR